MKTFAKMGLLLSAALLVTAAVAVGAQAVTINPDNTVVEGDATNPTLSYGIATVTCATGTADGVTGTDSDTIENLVIDFQGPCTVAGEDATVDCGSGSSTGDLVAQADTASGGTGTINLNADFLCVVTTDICTITVAGPQTTQNNNLSLNESTDVLAANVNVAASRSGSFLCGPTTGTGNFTANYATLPTNLTIDP